MTKPMIIVLLALAGLLITFPGDARPAKKVYRIGFLTAGVAKGYTGRVGAFERGLRDLGYVVGKNAIIEARYAGGQKRRLSALAKELVDLGVDIIVTHGDATLPADRAARASGRTIPIVFAVAADPIGSGFVSSLARPGGNITGLSDSHSDLVAKRLELLEQVVPSLKRVAVFWSDVSTFTRSQLHTLQEAAPAMGITLVPLKFGTHDDAEPAFAALRRDQPGALNVLGYPLVSLYRNRIAEFGLGNKLPIIGTGARNAEAGYLLSYGVNFNDLYRRAASYVDRIFKGAKPADLPVEQPTRFYLTVNLKTAKALGITIPWSILLRADRVIE